MTEFQRVDKARHRGYRWHCTECNKTFDYGAPRSPNVRAVSPVYCPECGACDFVRSAMPDVVNVHIDPLEPTAWQAFEPRMSMTVQPCAVCGARTPVYCLECDNPGARIHVCDKSACQHAHERTHKAEEEA
jgi:hypothetical protein